MQIIEKILCAKMRDSREIIVKENNKIIPLSIDQKPDDPEGKKRIEENGGEISQFEEDGEKSGLFRVWKKGEVSPGIAMSRSIGDFIETTFGVIPLPKFIDENIDKDKKFIVVASDGVWEFLDNPKVGVILCLFIKKMIQMGISKHLLKNRLNGGIKKILLLMILLLLLYSFKNNKQYFTFPLKIKYKIIPIIYMVHKKIYFYLFFIKYNRYYL